MANNLGSEQDRNQLRLWLQETEDDDCESVLGLEDENEMEEDMLEIHMDQEEEADDNDVSTMETDDIADGQNILEIEGNVENISADQCAIDQREFYIGKDKNTRWYLEPCMATTSRTQRHNIIPVFHRPGPKGNAKNANTHISSFECIFTEEIIEKIVFYTNIYIEKIKSNYSRDRDAKCTDKIEIRALLGILYLAGTMKSGRRNVISMWDNSRGTGVESVYITMSEHRFRFLMRCLRFDDVRDRDQRKELDKLAAIREIFTQFVTNSQNAYNPSDYMSIDEQLVAFHGNCPFRQYIPSKAAKYGIKVFALVSATNFYTTNLEVYVGTQHDGPFKVSNAPMDLVLRLVEPISGSNRNITADNWFVSLSLARALIEQKSLTIVGTVRGHRREVPQNFLPDKNREIYSSLFGYQQKVTLVSYVPKRNKAVIALSTMHLIGEIDESTGDEKKPVIITTYNETKFGVDILDKMTKQYDTSRNSRRWPLTIFFHLLNVGGVNSLNIFRANNNNVNVCRSDYLQTLGFELMKPAIHRRITLKNIPKEICTRAKILLGIEDEPQMQQPPPSGKKGRCVQCGRGKDKKVKTTCHKCNNFVCPEHSNTVCSNCF